MCIWCLFATQFSLVMLGQILVTCLESSYQKLEFCVTSFWFYWLWWSSWHTMLALFLLYVFFVWIFIIDFDEAADMQCWHCFSYSYFWFGYLVGVTCFRSQELTLVVLICSRFITFEKVTLYSSYCAWFVVLLASPYGALLHTCSYLFLAQFNCSVYIRIQIELHWPVQG